MESLKDAVLAMTNRIASSAYARADFMRRKVPKLANGNFSQRICDLGTHGAFEALKKAALQGYAETDPAYEMILRQCEDMKNAVLDGLVGSEFFTERGK